MLEESNKLLAGLKHDGKLREIKRAKRRFIFTKIRIWTIRLVIITTLFFIFYYPVETGNVIGTWLHNFFGTIYTHIK